MKNKSLKRKDIYKLKTEVVTVLFHLQMRNDIKREITSAPQIYHMSPLALHFKETWLLSTNEDHA